MQTTQELDLKTAALKNAALPFRALNNKLRMRILQLIHKNGRMMVTDLYKKLDIEQCVASAHLAILRKERIVTTERKGKFVYYSVNNQRIKEVEAFSVELLQEKPVTKQAETVNEPKIKREKWFDVVRRMMEEKGGI